jgi:hypothetical protein
LSRYSPYLRRLQRLEPEPEYVEPWPPDVEGSLAKLLYDQLREEGIELPAERPETPPLLWLVKNCAEECFSDEVEENGAA